MVFSTPWTNHRKYSFNFSNDFWQSLSICSNYRDWNNHSSNLKSLFSLFRFPKSRFCSKRSLSSLSESQRESKTNKVRFSKFILLYRGKIYCSKCKIIHREGVSTKHCDICDFCVEEREYHCALGTKCVGKRSKPYFIAYFFLSVSLATYLVAATVVSM